MTTDTLAGLRELVLAGNCEDRGATLVYADALEEAGDPALGFWRLVGERHLWPRRHQFAPPLWGYSDRAAFRPPGGGLVFYEWVCDGLMMSVLRPYAVSRELFEKLGKKSGERLYKKRGTVIRWEQNKRFGGPNGLRRALLALEQAWAATEAAGEAP